MRAATLQWSLAFQQWFLRRLKDNESFRVGSWGYTLLTSLPVEMCCNDTKRKLHHRGWSRGLVTWLAFDRHWCFLAWAACVLLRLLLLTSGLFCWIHGCGSMSFAAKRFVWFLLFGLRLELYQLVVWNIVRLHKPKRKHFIVVELEHAFDHFDLNR